MKKQDISTAKDADLRASQAAMQRVVALARQVAIQANIAIVPLRAANARTLIEQSIGRGLRLPYGKRTGAEAVDRLNIVAHDRFQEIIDEANKGDSVLRLQQVVLDAPNQNDETRSVQVASGMEAHLGLAEKMSDTGTTPNPPVFSDDNDKRIARVVIEVAAQYGRNPDEAPTSQALLQTDMQAKITEEVQKRLRPVQGELPMENAPNVADIVAKTTAVMVEKSIDIPRITVVPSGEVSAGFHPFKLDVSRLNLQPGEHELLIQNLDSSNKQTSLARGIGVTEKRPEDYIVHALMDFDDIDYFTQSELLYDLAGQMVAHLRSYLSEKEILNVLDKNSRLIAREIHAQMAGNFWEKATGYEAKVSCGFTPLKPCAYIVLANEPVHSVRDTVTDRSRISQMLFGHFANYLYPLQKFDSDTERRFAVILERDAQKWFKPAKGQFQIDYKLGMEQNEYLPDFVVETKDGILMIETKSRTDLDSAEVQAKAQAASAWCRHASDYASKHGGKAWHYLLIPHDEVNEARKLADFLQFEKKAA